MYDLFKKHWFAPASLLVLVISVVIKKNLEGQTVTPEEIDAYLFIGCWVLFIYFTGVTALWVFKNRKDIYKSFKKQDVGRLLFKKGK